MKSAVRFPALNLTVKDLACRRGGRLVFSGVSFALASGEALLLTGRNGAGKSSLIGTLMGRIEPDSGMIILEETGQSEGGTSLAEHVHHIGHKDGLKLTLTAHENLAYARVLLGKPDMDCDSALGRVGLAHARDIPVGYLSAGQKRRVALARLLVSSRPLWLLDEPTAALDVTSQEILSGLMAAHLDAGGLLIAATHMPLALHHVRELRLGGKA